MLARIISLAVLIGLTAPASVHATQPNDDEAKKLREQLEAAQKTIDAQAQKLLAEELKRLREERDALTIEREKAQREAQKLRAEKTDAELRVKTLLERNEQLLRALEEKARVDEKPKPAKADAAKAPAGVRGKVIRLNAATGLATINIGADAGVSTGDTLEVYRLATSPSTSASSKSASPGRPRRSGPSPA